MRTAPHQRLRIQQLSLSVRIGWSAEERRVPQEVRADVELAFSRPPAAMSTDALEDTVCYAKICSALRSHCEGKEFRLIEKLAADLYDLIHDLAGADASAGLTLHKVAPPVDGLQGGVFFRLGDFP